MKKSRIYIKLIVPLGMFILAAVSLYILWGGRGGNASYVDMACGFEGRTINCVDSIAEWHEGLAFYDSALAASNDTLGSLKKLLWDFWGIEFAGAGEAATSENAVLPLKVLETKKSGCMGLSWLALMVAEKRPMDLSAILLPGHVFLRYGKVSNLEPNRSGFSYTDEEYREKYRKGPWTGFEFKPLTSAQFMGLAAFNMGNLYLDKSPTRALTWYRMADSFFEEYPGIEANRKVAKMRLPDHL